MKSVELFSGIGGFRIACDNLEIETIWANDINELASTVYKENFKTESYVLGDISNHLYSIPDHNLLTAGFPCQPFSSAGKKLGVDDIRGTLFEKIIEILKIKKPEYFVLENVKRLLSMDKGRHFATIIDSLSSIGYSVEWRLLNAIDFGLPQHRERVIIVGRKSHVPLSYLYDMEKLRGINGKENNTMYDTSAWREIIKHGDKFNSWGVAIDGMFFHENLKSIKEKSETTTLDDVLEKKPSRSFFFTQDTLERIKNSEYVNKFFNGVQILYNQKGGARMGYSIFGTKGVAPTLTCTTSRHYERYQIGDEFRRLTNIEYARIQGFPDDHCQGIRVYNQYSLYGNAVPPKMAEWAIDKLINGQSVQLNKIK